MAVCASRVEEERATAKHLAFACLSALAKEKSSPAFFYRLFMG